MANAIEVRPELLPVKDFAARLGVSVWTARSWCYRGTVASVKIGSKLLVPIGEVGRIISENMRPRLQDVHQ
jgi:predicted site-specific integrase-resolvase